MISDRGLQGNTLFAICVGILQSVAVRGRQFHPSAEWDIPDNIQFVPRAFLGQSDKLSDISSVWAAANGPCTWKSNIVPWAFHIMPVLSAVFSYCTIFLLGRKIIFCFSCLVVGVFWFYLFIDTLTLHGIEKRLLESGTCCVYALIALWSCSLTSMCPEGNFLFWKDGMCCQSLIACPQGVPALSLSPYPQSSAATRPTGGAQVPPLCSSATVKSSWGI